MFKLVVLSCVLAVTTASQFLGGYVAPLTPITPLAYAARLWQPSNYRGPLSLAPGQPANILAADGRPLDTLDVNLDRSAHFTAKALDNGFHILKKRSVISPFIAPASYISPYDASYVTPFAAPLAYSASILQPYNYRGPLSLAPGQPANILGADGRPLDTLDVNLDRSAHIAAKVAANSHLIKKRSTPFIAPVPAIAIARSPLITPSYTIAAPLAAAHLGPIVYARPFARYAGIF